jgi:hypothetical protein
VSFLTTTRAKTSSAVAAGFLAVTLLTSCSSAEPALSDEASTELQTAVSAIATPAAASDPGAALAALDTFKAQFDAQVAAGAITTDRAAEIQANIDRVRVDLQALIDAGVPAPAPVETTTPEPSEEPTEEPEPEPTETAEEETPEPVAPAPSKPAPAPTKPAPAAPSTNPAPATGNNGNGNSNGNGNGNGNGNSGNAPGQQDDELSDDPSDDVEDNESE